MGGFTGRGIYFITLPGNGKIYISSLHCGVIIYHGWKSHCPLFCIGNSNCVNVSMYLFVKLQEGL